MINCPVVSGSGNGRKLIHQQVSDKKGIEECLRAGLFKHETLTF
jgi:hypothetical protein